MNARQRLVLAGLAAISWQACTPSSQPTGSEASDDGHRLILVVLEGVRTDRLGSYGAGAGQTPNLDRFAAESVRFEWAFAQSPQPTSSLTSLLTGLYAYSHGVLEEDDRLVDEAQTVAELLRGEGFTTAAFLEGAPSGRDLGLEQGFDRFERGSGTAEKGLAWLAENGDESVFLMLGLPPVVDTEATADDVSEGYDDRVAALDSAFGRILDAVEAAGPSARTTLAVVSLVGADLEEREPARRPSLYAPITRVPLFLRSRGLPAGATVDKIVEVVDLMPTLLEMGDVEAPAAIQGRSLRSLIGGAGNPPYIAFGESLGDGEQFFVALGGYRMVKQVDTDGAEQIELFDLAADPQELDDIAATDEKRIPVLEDHLQAWRKMTAAASLDPERRTEELDDDTLEKLRSLGYVQ